MKKLLPTLVFAVAVGANLVAPGFGSPVAAETVKAKCRPAAPPKGLKRDSLVKSMRDGRKYQLSDRRGWIYALIPGKGWVVMKCRETSR